MPNANSSYADIVRDWEKLLTSTKENASDLVEAERHRAALEEHLAATKVLKAKQDANRAEKQENTRELKAALVKGRELAIRLRGVVRANLGPRSELLTKFGVAPLRKRSRAGKPAEGETPEGPAPVAPKAGGDPPVIH
jgi:hypothetical protein